MKSLNSKTVVEQNKSHFDASLGAFSKKQIPAPVNQHNLWWLPGAAGFFPPTARKYPEYYRFVASHQGHSHQIKYKLLKGIHTLDADWALIMVKSDTLTSISCIDFKRIFFHDYLKLSKMLTTFQISCGYHHGPFFSNGTNISTSCTQKIQITSEWLVSCWHFSFCSSLNILTVLNGWDKKNQDVDNIWYSWDSPFERSALCDSTSSSISRRKSFPLRVLSNKI
jgi:hypothetical protein